MPPVRTHTKYEQGIPTSSLDEPPDLSSGPLPDSTSLANQPMSFTFCSEFSFSPPTDVPSGPVASTSALTSTSTEVELPFPTSPPQSSHSRRRDASYIPRPPNAFILFRSSFIRSQQVTGKVEGNHSNLSKIIGMYWKTLPQAERDEWEAKAVVAQAEHRKRYPDWRFRPATTTVAKLKCKDTTRSRRRRVQGTTDPPDGGGEASQSGPPVVPAHDGQDAKGKGREKSAGRGRGRGRGRSKIGAAERGKVEKKNDTEKSREDQRLSKITDLLVEGKKGVELEIAVQEWERGRKVTRLQDRCPGEKADSRSRLADKSPPFSVTVFSSEPSTSSLPLPSEPPSTSTSADASPVVQSLSNTASPSSWPATPVTGSLDRPSLLRTAIDPASYTRFRHHDSRRSSRSRSPSRFQRRTCSPSSTEGDSRSCSPVVQATDDDSRRLVPPEYHSPSDTTSNLSLVPLTHLYRRSLSAPAPHHRPGNSKVSTVAPPSLPPASLITQGDPSDSIPAVRPRRDSGLDQSETTSVVSQPLEFPQRTRNPFVFTPQHYALDPPAVHHGHVRRGTISLPLVPNNYQHPYHNPTSLRHHRHSLSTHYEDPQQLSEQRRYEDVHARPSWSVPWQEVQKGARSWWADDGGAEVNLAYGEDDEPVREGSFDHLQDTEDNLGYPPEQRNRDNLTSPTRVDPPMNDGSHVVSWADMPGRRGLVSVNLSLDIGTPSFVGQLNTPGPFTSGAIENHPSSSGLALPVSYPPQPVSFPSHVTNSSEGFFFPTAPERMSPMTPLSSFSSLAGWDGEAMSRADMSYSSAPGVVVASEEGGGRSQVSAGVQWPALAWGHVQPLGLRGGGEGDWRGGGVEGAASWPGGGEQSERS